MIPTGRPGRKIAGNRHDPARPLDQRAVSGETPGTADKPFKTINAAVARLKPGDTLHVHEGVYRETVELTGANAYQGQPGAHIRIIAWPKEVVEIKGVQSHCRITRQDGTVVELKWEAGKNIGPSLTTWNNDNEWYPVKDIEWILDDDSAAVLIFGVTSNSFAAGSPLAKPV